MSLLQTPQQTVDKIMTLVTSGRATLDDVIIRAERITKVAELKSQCMPEREKQEMIRHCMEVERLLRQKRKGSRR